ncbi:hypothetical protein F4818DRAFT_396598 [Hypoxylon cercidicola]|nr:hypothetical protein F4818DRAFT_396598 [Hypoxylon cercidicola]
MRQTSISGISQEAAAATPRQPRLRSSCDGCGTAKLKCDRNHPECGRCRALGLTCVYGISRKFGKPQRGREAQAMDLRAELPRALSHAPRASEYPISMDVDKFEGKNDGGNITALNYSPLSGINTIYDNTATDLVNGTDKSDAYTDPLGPSLSNFVSLDLDEWIFSRHHGDNLWTPNDLDISTSPEATHTHWREQPTTHQHEKVTYDQDNSSIANNRGHDCTREAHDLLSSLSFASLNKMAISPLTLAPSPGAGEGVPLDHVLRINREASDRLTRLLTCPCARSPHLALLYASIFSRVLIWYQQAAGCAQTASWIPTSAMADPEAAPNGGSMLSRAASSSGSGASPSPWSSTAVTPDNTSIPTTSHTSSLGVVHTQMAMGSFNIDDQCVQAALNLQLVLSEMKRASCVVDLFSSRAFYSSSSQANPDSTGFGGDDGLYKSLSSWLRGEHTRIIGIMRSRLRELSDNIHP